MKDINDLKQVLKQTLQERGVLSQIRAQIRSEIFGTLNGDSATSKPSLSNENLVVNQLIREYLLFNGYAHTLSVFLPESGQPNGAIDRVAITRQLNITEDRRSQELPLIYGLTFGKKKAVSQK